MRGKHAAESPGGGEEPQEIDGEDGENPSLCRNRIESEYPMALSRNASQGIRLESGGHRRSTETPPGISLP